MGAPMRALAIGLALLAPPVTHTVLPVFVPPAGQSQRGGMEVVWSSMDNSPSSVPIRLGVFRRPRTPADEAPQRLRIFAQFVGGRLNQSRLLLAADTMQIYAFPADGGKVCFMRLPFGGGSCIASLVDGAYPQVDARQDVWGIVDDAATGVDVHIGKRVLHPNIGRNAFYAKLPAHVVVPTRIVVHDRDGSSHIFDAERCSTADISPLSAPLGPSC
jgi:hypothetical protein